LKRPTFEQPRPKEADPLAWSNWDGWSKSVFDFCAALVILVLTAPVLLLAALLVKLTSRGPALYIQKRLGRDGKIYSIYKLRTMQHECEKHSGPCWSTQGDPRITPLGRFLRKSHIDELPQLFNILRGEMSLVGPRPERPEFLPDLEEALPLYRTRLKVKPGVTGLAQVQLPPDTDLASVRRKLAYDLYYVQHASSWMDFQIVLATALHVVRVPYGVLSKLIFLPADQRIERSYRNIALKTGVDSAAEIAICSDSSQVGAVEMVTL
jgi:lipopolysaccharide/colanic/teichoic acid biosynthesis glycosyltransferase